MPETGDILDLLKNEYFVQWVLSPTDESRHFWTKWMASHPERKQDVDRAIQIITSGKYKIDETMPEEDYDLVLENIVNYGLQKRRKRSTITRTLWRPVGIAASVLLVLSFALYQIMEFNEVSQEVPALAMIEKEAPLGRKITTRLPDGSIVSLNAGSKITFPEKFDGAAREVALSGEAFFDVEHNPEQPFVVKMNGDEVKVLGTSFNIRSYAGDKTVQVSVATGKVAYTVPTGERIYLLPDQMATYTPEDGSLVKGEVDQLKAFGWKDRIIYFNEEQFAKIVTELERWYGVKIEAKGDFERIGTFSGEFRNESLDQVLTGLSFVYQFEFSIDESKVYINEK